MKISKTKLKNLLVECGYLGYHYDGKQFYDLKGLVNTIVNNPNLIIVKRKRTKK